MAYRRSSQAQQTFGTPQDKADALNHLTTDH